MKKKIGEDLIVNLENCISVIQVALNNGKPWTHVTNDNRDSIEEVESVIQGARDAIKRANASTGRGVKCRKTPCTWDEMEAAVEAAKGN